MSIMISEVQLDILYMAAEHDDGPRLPAHILAEPTIAGLLNSGLMMLDDSMVVITAHGRSYLAATRMERDAMLQGSDISALAA
jgi:hypothetical protein